MFENLVNQSGSIFGGGNNNEDSIFGGSSAFDSLDLMSNYGELRENPNNYFNFRAQHLGTIGVVERMAGLVAHREDMSFGDISLAETYKDSALNTRVMGGIYNKTISDMYKNRDDYLRLQGAYTLGGMITEGGSKKESSPFDNKTTAKILGSDGLGKSNYLEGDTIYGQIAEVKKNDDIEKKLSMSELIDAKNSPFENKKGTSPFDNPNGRLLISDGVGGTSGYIEGSTIYEKGIKQKEIETSVSMREILEKKNDDSIKTMRHLAPEVQEFSVTTSNPKTTETKKVTTRNVEKMMENIIPNKPSIRFDEKKPIDTLKVDRDKNQKTFSEKEEKKQEVKPINKDLLGALGKEDLKAPKLELKARKIVKEETTKGKIEVKQQKVFRMD